MLRNEALGVKREPSARSAPPSAEHSCGDIRAGLARRCQLAEQPWYVAVVALLRSQKNEIFSLITAAGLDPREFEWRAETSGAELLVHRPSGFRFHVEAAGSSSWRCDYSPAEERETASGSSSSWNWLIRDYVRPWVDFLAREITVPDFWGALEQERELIGATATQVTNTRFTAPELEAIARQLDEAKQYLQQAYQLTEEQGAVLEARLEYLKDAATRLSRIDWRNAVSGALLTLALEVLVPPEAIRDALAMIFRGLGQLFGHEIPALP